MTGRGAGYCAGDVARGYSGHPRGRGFGRGRGRGGRGSGRGRGSGFGWGRGGGVDLTDPRLEEEGEAPYLRAESTRLRAQVESLERRLAALEKAD